MFIALGEDGGKGGDGSGILGVIIFLHCSCPNCNSHCECSSCKGEGNRTGPLEEDDRTRQCRLKYIRGDTTYYRKHRLRFCVSIYNSPSYQTTSPFALRNSIAFFESSVRFNKYVYIHASPKKQDIHMICTIHT